MLIVRNYKWEYILNPKATEYTRLLNNPTFVDKSELVSFTNQQIDFGSCRIVSSRPRRFGKTLAAKMLLCYYCKDYDSHEIFKNLKISNDPSIKNTSINMMFCF